MDKKIGIIALVLFFAVITVAAVALNSEQKPVGGGGTAATNTFPTSSATPKPTATTKPSPSTLPSPTATPTATPAPTPKSLITTRNYYIDFKQLEDTRLVLVNSYIPLSESYQVTPRLYSGETVDDLVFLPLTQMLDDAKSAGLSLWIASGYRSVEDQEELLEDGIQNRMDDFSMTREEAEENALQSFSKPGYSEHHTGLAVDFNSVSRDFEHTDEYGWLSENAWKYGFIQRYPKDKTEITGIIYEPWHYRYVGEENAKKITDSGLCLEEYIINMKNL